MALIEIKDPTARDLRLFGLLMLVFVSLVGALVWWRGAAPNVAYGVWGAGSALAAVYYAAPPLRRKIYFGWLYAAYPIGYVVSHLVMGAVYFGVITPIALVMRLLGRDALALRIDRQATSYWVENRTRERDPGSYFRQF